MSQWSSLILHCISFPGTVTKYHKLGHLKYEKCVVSQIRRLEVSNQSTNRAVLPQKPAGENPSSSPLGFWVAGNP